MIAQSQHEERYRSCAAPLRDSGEATPSTSKLTVDTGSHLETLNPRLEHTGIADDGEFIGDESWL